MFERGCQGFCQALDLCHRAATRRFSGGSPGLGNLATTLAVLSLAFQRLPAQVGAHARVLRGTSVAFRVESRRFGRDSAVFGWFALARGRRLVVRH
jgi:hypothetical protein